MRSAGENSPLRSSSSNGTGRRALARACERLSRAATDALVPVLADCVDGLRAERGFLVEAGGDGRVVTRHVVGEGLSLEPSRTALRWALAGDTARLWRLSPASLADSGSLRRLGLRTVLAAPVPGRPTTTGLLLDSRCPPRDDDRSLHQGLAAFAALLGAAVVRAGNTREREAPVPGGVPGAPQPAYERVLDQARRAAATRLPVLIEGETGTGKERLAREIHRLSGRGPGPFVAINCATLPESLLEAELFGAERGAFTGADRARPGLFRAAHGGTLLLDEIGDMPASMQAKLLRALQEERVRPLGADRECPVDVRVVGATHRALAREVEAGRFRADLYYRLAVLELRLPPLRDRTEDLPGLVESLTPRLLDETGATELTLRPEAWSLLRRHGWPGNVRELRTALARALVRGRGGPIGVEHLRELHVRTEREARGAEGLERAMILDALAHEGGIVAAAAARIGWSRQKLYRRMRALDVAVPRQAQSRSERTWRIASSESSTFQ